MTPFTSITGVVVPLIEDDLNTDQMAPIHADQRLDTRPSFSRLNGLA